MHDTNLNLHTFVKTSFEVVGRSQLSERNGDLLTVSVSSAKLASGNDDSSNFNHVTSSQAPHCSTANGSEINVEIENQKAASNAVSRLQSDDGITKISDQPLSSRSSAKASPNLLEPDPKTGVLPLHKKLGAMSSNISSGFGGRSISSWLLGERNSNASSDSFINVSGIVFEAMAKNMVPIFTIMQPDLASSRTGFDFKSQANALAERRKDLESAEVNGNHRSSNANNLTVSSNPTRSCSFIGQLAWQAAILTHPYCQYFENFGEFWSGVVRVLASYRGPSNQGMTLEHLNAMIKTLGLSDERTSSPIPPLSDSTTLLFLKSAMLEELLASHVRLWHRRLYGSEKSARSSCTDVRTMLSASANSRPSKSGNRNFMKREESSGERGSKFSRRCCQTMRSWYKLVSYVLAEAKDAYLHEQIRRHSQSTTVCEVEDTRQT